MLSDLKNQPILISPEERLSYLSSFDGICLSSDALIPFRDNIDRASRSNIQYIAQAGGSTRDKSITKAADEYKMIMAHTGMRLFLH